MRLVYIYQTRSILSAPYSMLLIIHTLSTNNILSNTRNKGLNSNKQIFPMCIMMAREKSVGQPIKVVRISYCKGALNIFWEGNVLLAHTVTHTKPIKFKPRGANAPYTYTCLLNERLDFNYHKK